MYLKYLPDDEEALYIYSGLLYEKKEYNEAQLLYNKIILLNPKSAQYLVERGNNFFMNKSYLSAETDYNQALDLDPKNAEAYNNRALCRMFLKNEKGACSDFKKAAALKFPGADEQLKKNCR